MNNVKYFKKTMIKKTRKYKIPKDYKPYKGFYDLREFEVPIKVFKKLWDVHGTLFHMEENKEYFKKFVPYQWADAKEISADYQQLLFRYKHYENI